jgi:hypothetical protein
MYISNYLKYILNYIFDNELQKDFCRFLWILVDSGRICGGIKSIASLASEAISLKYQKFHVTPSLCLLNL